MTPANATQDRYAPVWERLRVWRGLALKAAGQTPEHLSRAQVEPMLRWIFVLEFILRRLVLIAAAALTIRLPQKSTRATPTLSRRAVTTARATATAFRLKPSAPARAHITRPRHAIPCRSTRSSAPDGTTCPTAPKAPRKMTRHRPNHPRPNTPPSTPQSRSSRASPISRS